MIPENNIGLTSKLSNQAVNHQKQTYSTLQSLKKQIGFTLAGCFGGSYLTLAHSYRKHIKKHPPSKLFPRIRYTLNNTFFLQTSITFLSKIFVDLVFPS